MKELPVAPQSGEQHCPLCQSGDKTPMMRKNDYRIVRCSACTIMPVSPRPPLLDWVERATATIQAQLADGSARLWWFWLHPWRALPCLARRTLR